MSDLIRIGGMYKKEKNGKRYLSGKVMNAVALEKGQRIVVHMDIEKRQDNWPDCSLVCYPLDETDDWKREKKPDEEKSKDQDRLPPIEDDSMPF